MGCLKFVHNGQVLFTGFSGNYLFSAVERPQVNWNLISRRTAMIFGSLLTLMTAAKSRTRGQRAK